jgi:serine/threonine-protein kinase
MVVAGRYTLERCINTAGIGSFWRACDEQTGSTCGLRLAEGTGHNLFELAARYNAEVEINERIRCENVVDILDHGEWNGMPYVVIEHVDGEDLASYLRREIFLQPKIAYRLLAQTARALARAHAVGIVHGDLTPENVLIASDGMQPVAKLFNFGLTQKTPEIGVANLTKIGSFLRLPYYASPEQAGGKSIDWRTDLWSLGVLGYECLTGRKPFESNVFGDLLALIVFEPIPELKLPGIDTPPALEAWWKTASTRDPARRFQSAREMSEALGQAFDFPLVFVPEVSSGSVEKKASSPAIPVGRRVGSEESPVDLGSRPTQKGIRHSTKIGIGADVRSAVLAASASKHAAANAPLSPSAPEVVPAPVDIANAPLSPSAPEAAPAPADAAKAGLSPSAPQAATADFDEEDFGTFQADEAPTTLMQDSVLVGWVDEDPEADLLVAALRRTRILRVAVSVLAAGLLVFVAFVVHRQVLTSKAKRAVPTAADSRETPNFKQELAVVAVPPVVSIPIAEDAGVVVQIKEAPAVSVTASTGEPKAEAAGANVKIGEPRTSAHRTLHDANAIHAKPETVRKTKTETAPVSKPSPQPTATPAASGVVPKPAKPKATESAHDYGI